jgi:hypothetical protein
MSRSDSFVQKWTDGSNQTSLDAPLVENWSNNPRTGISSVVRTCQLCGTAIQGPSYCQPSAVDMLCRCKIREVGSYYMHRISWSRCAYTAQRFDLSNLGVQTHERLSSSEREKSIWGKWSCLLPSTWLADGISKFGRIQDRRSCLGVRFCHKSSQLPTSLWIIGTLREFPCKRM